MERKPDISIIIVNYRVKDYISLLLHSIKKAEKDLRVEIIIVDNNSQDDSIEYLSRNHDDIKFIQNIDNRGFSKANNQGLSQANGTYTLIINPDTILEENSLVCLKEFLDSNNNCGAAGFKVINPDGTFARECRRSIPDLKSAIFRVLSLDVLFPKSRFFGGRYLAWLDKSKITRVPVISGAGMFWKTSLLKSLNGFDEEFFMYGEDDDLCLRMKNSEKSIYYFPEAKMVHFKGESERDVSISQIKKINEGLIKFFKKHYKVKYSHLSLKLISLAFSFRVLGLYIKQTLIKKRSSKFNGSLPGVFIGDQVNLSLLNEKLGEDILLISPLEGINDIKEALFFNPKKKTDFSNIIFDTDTVPYHKAFEMMESLKNRGLNFYFLLSDERKIIGKSSVIDF
ncbi:MAG: glycosyltransferase family 2 protein [Balneola sp.]